MEQTTNHKPLPTAADVELRVQLEARLLEEYKNMPDGIPSDQTTKALEEIIEAFDWYNQVFTDEATQKQGLTDCMGEVLIPAMFDEICLCFEYMGRQEAVLVKDKGLYGFVKPDGQGTLVQPCIYERIRIGFQYTSYAVQLPGSPYWGLLDDHANLLIPCEADEVTNDGTNGWFLYKKNGLYGIARLGGYILPAEYDDIQPDGYEEPIVFVKNGQKGRVGFSTGKFFSNEQIANMSDEEFDAQHFLCAM